MKSTKVERAAMDDVRRIIRQALRRSKMSQSDVCAKLDVNAAFLSHLMTSQTNVTLHTVVNVLHATGHTLKLTITGRKRG